MSAGIEKRHGKIVSVSQIGCGRTCDRVVALYLGAPPVGETVRRAFGTRQRGDRRRSADR